MRTVCFHHHPDVFLPGGFKMDGLIIGRLGLIPDIREFIHDVHTEFITGFEHGLGCMIMRRAHRIESGFFETADPALFISVIGTCTQKAAVMMYTGAAQLDAFSVDQKTVNPIRLQKSDTGDDAVLIRSGVLFNRCCCDPGTGSI